MLEDNALALRIQRGDETAFEQFFKKHQKRVYNITFTKLADPHLAEEVTQDVFVKVWQKAKKWNAGKGTFLSWVNVITKHTIIDAIRKRDRQRVLPIASMPEAELMPLANYADASPGPDRLADMAEAQAILETALCQLKKPNHRIAWILRYLEGYSVKETGDILNQKGSTVKVWVFRGTQELRDILTRTGKASYLESLSR